MEGFSTFQVFFFYEIENSKIFLTSLSTMKTLFTVSESAKPQV